MPFYKVPSPNSISLPDIKRARAPLRQSQASSPDPPAGSRTIGSSISASGSVQTFGGFSDNGAYVNGGGGGAGGGGGGGGGGDWSKAADSSHAPKHQLAANMNGSRHHAVSPDQQVSIVELEIQQQSKREAELMALRQSLYQQTSPQSTLTSEYRVNRTSTGPERTPSSDPRSKVSSAPRVATQSDHPPTLLPSSSSSSLTIASSAVTYEEAILTRAHPGESLIAREIMELKMREEELKRNRKELGRVTPDSTSALTQSKHPTNPAESVPHQMAASSISPSFAHSSGASQKYDAVDGESRTRRPTSRIRPLDEPGAEEVKFLPQEEKPIEREMRLAGEREDALRQARGLPAMSRADEEATVVEMRLPDGAGTTGGTSASGADRKSDQTMKKLASSRLMVEIEKEKQRELELRRHNQRPSHLGNTTVSAAGDQSNTKSNSYIRK